MISNICYAVVFLIESLISFYYFDFKFERKVSKPILILCIIGSFSILYLLEFLEIPMANLIGFLLCNFFIAKKCYYTKITSALFNVLILVFLMIVTELIVFYFSSLLFHLPLFESYNDEFVLIVQAVICKMMYFLSVHIVLKISKKEKSETNPSFSLVLCILPIASIILMYTTVYLCIIYSVNDAFKISIVLGNILLLISNIVVFYVNEITIQVNNKYTQILLENQQKKDTIDYYELLREQNENSKILIHDITKHLNTIQQLSENKDSNISQYISEIVADYSVMNPVDYCNNSIVNLITHRYNDLCQKNNITFTISIKNANINFMKEHDITAILDNLLENAVDSANISEKRFIDFTISTRNSNFTVIKVSNSCDNKPSYKNGSLISSKHSAGLHGIGTRSIKRTVEKYHGNLDMKYDEISKTFISTIILNSK